MLQRLVRHAGRDARCRVERSGLALRPARPIGAALELYGPGLLSLVLNSFDTASNLMCRNEIERRRALLALTTSLLVLTTLLN
jgi:hypothetical protein